MNILRSMPARGIFVIQTVMLFAWLCAAEYVVTLPFFATAAIAVAIVTLGGLVASRCVTRALTVLDEAYKVEETKRTLEFHRVVSMMPSLHEAFRVLHPELTRDRYELCHFSIWLAASLRNSGANIVQWAMSYGERPGAERPLLSGLDSHIAEDQRVKVSERVRYAVLIGHALMVLYREEAQNPKKSTTRTVV